MTEELIALLGLDAFVKFSYVFGGAKLFVGIGKNTEMKLSVVMGKEAAIKMIKAYPSQWLYVPKYTASVTASRNILIAKDCDAGLSISQLAMKYELSQRQISYILKKPNLTTYKEN